MTNTVVVGWVWFGVAAISLTLRYISRIKDRGKIQRFQLDDYLVLLALGFYAIQVSANNAAYIHMEKVRQLSDNHVQLVQSDQTVSKLYVVVEQARICVDWLVKACLLTLYYRITVAIPREHFAIKLIIGYCVFTFIMLETFYFFVWCRPFADSWNPGKVVGQCSIPIHHCIMDLVFNASSDLLMIAVMVPMIARSALPIRQKLFVCCLFAPVLFCIFCTAASKYYIFTFPYGPQWLNFYSRESSTAIVVANLSVMSSMIRNTASFVSRQVKKTRSLVLGAKALPEEKPIAPMDHLEFVTTSMLAKNLNTFEDIELTPQAVNAPDSDEITPSATPFWVNSGAGVAKVLEVSTPTFLESFEKRHNSKTRFSSRATLESEVSFSGSEISRKGIT